MPVLSLQSHVAYGHVGNAAAAAGARELRLVAAQAEIAEPGFTPAANRMD